MVRVNRNKLSKKEQDELFKQFNKLLGKLSDKNANVFLEELLGSEERLTIAKRIATIIMLREGYSAYLISDRLKLSSSTTDRISKKLKKGEYSRLEEILTTQKATYSALIDLMESILTVGGIMPKRSGLDRYRGIRG